MPNSLQTRPRRSVLYVPGSNPRAIEKARSVPADGIIIDLEDAVAPETKSAARGEMCAGVRSGGFGSRELVVRVNGLDTDWGAADIRAVVESGIRTVLFPKIDGASELQAAVALLNRAGGQSLAVWVMIETPKAIQAVDQIVNADPRVEALVMGTADLAKALRLPAEASRIGLLYSLGRCVVAARASRVDILDGVFGDLRDSAGLRASCQQGRAMGFDGKTLIHPDQIDAANEIFGVSAEQAAAAARIIAAWEAAAAVGRGIAVLDGQMVEKLHADEARRTIALRESIKETRR
jgi:citrate lyase subunit beta / citryl-CoA lyase